MVLAALTFVAVALTVSLLLAPLEALGWWAGWFGEEERRHPAPAAERHRDGRVEAPGPDLYVVYLDGIAKAGHANYRDVQGFLARLQRALPRAAVLGDVLPYSPSRRGLTEGRPLSRKRTQAVCNATGTTLMEQYRDMERALREAAGRQRERDRIAAIVAPTQRLWSAAA